MKNNLHIKKKLRNQLLTFMPESAVDVCVDWIVEYKVHFRITRPRSSKYGDYQAPSHTGGHRISVNGDLNPYSFLLVFVHEMAHLINFLAHGHRVKPHGLEWKNHFHELMKPFFQRNVFPEDLNKAVKKSMRNPPASGCVDAELFKALRKYDAEQQGVLVENLLINELFALPTGKVYRRGEKLRKRYRCREIGSNNTYLFSAIAVVHRLQQEMIDRIEDADRKIQMSSNQIRLKDLSENSIFALKNGKVFQRGKKLRKRYQCKELSTNHMYTIDPLIEVRVVKG